MVIDRCCWKRWWTAAVFAGPATVLPTGCMLGKPQDAAAWTASIKLTAKPSKTSTSIRWCRRSVSSYAVISYGKQIRQAFHDLLVFRFAPSKFNVQVGANTRVAVDV